MQSETTKSDDINRVNELRLEHQEIKIDDLELEVRNLRFYIKMLKEELANALTKISTISNCS